MLGFHRGQAHKLHRARWRKLGRHHEAKICLVCGICRVKIEEFEMSRLTAVLGSQVNPSPVFNEEEMALINSFADKEQDEQRMAANDWFSA